METLFDFTISDVEYVYNIDSYTTLCIKRLSHSVALLYFINDELNELIPVPNGIVVYEYDYQNPQKIVIMRPIDKSYPLSWTDNYTIALNNNIIINIQNQRKWNIVHK